MRPARGSPEQLLPALLLQVLCTIRSERQLMEQLDYDLIFRWFVGLGMDASALYPTTFRPSMGSVGDCYDNAMPESFLRPRNES